MLPAASTRFKVKWTRPSPLIVPPALNLFGGAAGGFLARIRRFPGLLLPSPANHYNTDDGMIGPPVGLGVFHLRLTVQLAQEYSRRSRGQATKIPLRIDVGPSSTSEMEGCGN